MFPIPWLYKTSCVWPNDAAFWKSLWKLSERRAAVDSQELQHGQFSERQSACMAKDWHLPVLVLLIHRHSKGALLSFWRECRDTDCKHPEDFITIPKFHVERLSCDIAIDPFGGVGGNAVQLATTCKQVLVSDINMDRLLLARHNAKVYGVEMKMDFVCGDFLKMAPHYQVSLKIKRITIKSCLYYHVFVSRMSCRRKRAVKVAVSTASRRFQLCH